MGLLPPRLLRRISAGRLCLVVVVAALLGPFMFLAACTAEKDNPIVLENQQPGSAAWQVGLPGFLAADDGGQIEGYASATSVNKGEPVAFHVSVSPAQSFSADIYRMGWYGGLGGRLLANVGPMPAARQRPCTPGADTGLVDCGWPTSFTFNVPVTWTSGIYLVLLTNAEKYQSYITFVVRDDLRKADLLYQQSVTTYQAYNNYPDDGKIGKSLYDFNSYGATVPATRAKRAAKVSFDRPYSDGNGSGQFFRGVSGSWERYFVGWLESSGYDVTYSTDIDTHASGALLLDAKGFLSVGHDEYWSKAMMDAATQARDSGVSLGFFGSNTAYWQVRFEPSPRGSANRVMVCYKDAGLDPVKGPLATVKWRDPPVNRPEQSLVGIQYTAHLKDEGQGSLYVVQNSSHWVWNGTGVTDGNEIPGIVGYETDRFMPDYPKPANSSYTVLSRSPVVDRHRPQGLHQLLDLPGAERRLGIRLRQQLLERRSRQTGSHRSPSSASHRECARPLPSEFPCPPSRSRLALGVDGGRLLELGGRAQLAERWALGCCAVHRGEVQVGPDGLDGADLNGRHAEFSGQHRESFDHLQLSGQGDDESRRVGVVQHRHRHYTVQPGIPGRIPGGGWRHLERCQVDRHREGSPDRRRRRIRPNGPLERSACRR